jgi:hypothetical protein
VGEGLLESCLEGGVCEAEQGEVFNFFEPVEVELSDEAGEFVVSEVGGQDLLFEFVFVKDVDFGFGLVELYDCFVVFVLRGRGVTLRMEWNLEMKLLGFESYCMR